MSAPAPIHAVQLVSDGLLVQFAGGLRCYFSAHFLLSNLTTGSNQVFLDYDPSAQSAPSTMVELPRIAVSAPSPQQAFST